MPEQISRLQYRACSKSGAQRASSSLLWLGVSQLDCSVLARGTYMLPGPPPPTAKDASVYTMYFVLLQDSQSCLAWRAESKKAMTRDASALTSPPASRPLSPTSITLVHPYATSTSCGSAISLLVRRREDGERMGRARDPAPVLKVLGDHPQRSHQRSQHWQ